MYIGKSKYVSEQGKYPVIKLNLKSVESNSWEDMYSGFKEIIREIYSSKKYLLEILDDDEKALFQKFLTEEADLSKYKLSLKILSNFLYRYYNQKVILLIDEYDVPIQKGYIKGFYSNVIDFIKGLFNNALKSNDNIEFAVMTGVLRVSKESIFSDLNNVKVYSIMNNPYDEYFGFTEQETEEFLKYYNLSLTPEVKSMYDGYIFGEKEIYNPWSIINYAEEGLLFPYWVNTSSNDLIKLILKNSTTVKEKIERLLKGEEVEVKIDLETIITGIEQKEDNIWGLLLGTGYLKAVEVVDLQKKLYKVKIVNYEVKSLFENIIDDWFRDKVKGNDLNMILKDLITLNIEEFKEKFETLVIQMFSFWDVGEDTVENFYHAFVLGMLVTLKDTYYINSNRESGLGRYDIMLEPKNKNANSFIMEFKVLKKEKEKTLEKTIENAKKQIEEKRYEETLKERGFSNITKMVFAFQGKEVDLVFYSTVRTGSAYGVGFVSDIRRMNVSFTRPRFGLYVVGNEAKLRTSKYWNQFIDYT